MDFLSQNLTTLSCHRPGLFGSLRAHFERAAGEAASSVLSETSCDDVLRSFALSSLQEPRLLIVDGCREVFASLLPRLPATTRDVLVVEKSCDAFVATLRRYDLSAAFADDKFEFFIGLREADFVAALKIYFKERERLIYADRIEHFYTASALNADGEYYLSFARAAQQAVSDLKSCYVTPGEDNYRALLNILGNRERLATAPFVFALKGSLHGKNAVLAGAGPSLAAECDALRAHREKFFLMAVDAAVKPLLAAGIIPDAVVAAERVSSIARFFERLPRDFAAPLFTLPSVHPRVWETYPGPVVLLRRDATFGAWLLPDSPEMPVPLGVSSVAYSVLGWLGCREIALVGQDLSFPPDEAPTHASGTDDYAQATTRDAKSWQSVTVPGEDAEVLTTEGWRTAITELSELIPFYGVSCRHVIAKGRGALIAGAQRVVPEFFWNEVAARLPTDTGALFWDAVLRLKAPAVAVDMRSLASESVVYLERVSAACLDFMQELSRDYHDDIDYSDNAAVWPRVNEILNRWELARRRVVDVDPRLFYFFLNMCFGTSHILHLSAREAIRFEPDKAVFCLFHHLLKTIDWGTELVAWAARMRHAMEGVA